MYEDSINPHIAKKLTEERSRDYMNARNVTKEYEIMTKGLSRNIPSVPPQVTPLEVKQVELWKKYIQWEKDNPLKTEDITTITKRGESPPLSFFFKTFMLFVLLKVCFLDSYVCLRAVSPLLGASS